eukprot:1140695-Pelagomonas_calceolata.AAC.2
MPPCQSSTLKPPPKSAACRPRTLILRRQMDLPVIWAWNVSLAPMKRPRSGMDSGANVMIYNRPVRDIYD